MCVVVVHANVAVVPQLESTPRPAEVAERPLRIRALDTREHECLDRGGSVLPVVPALHC